MTEHQYTMTAVKDCACPRCIEFRTRAEMENEGQPRTNDELFARLTGAEPAQPSPYSDEAAVKSPVDIRAMIAAAKELNAIKKARLTEGRFDQLLAQMKQVHDKKGQDYEAHNIPYENIKASEQWSVEPWTYAMLRVSEKIRRLHSVAKGKQLQNEDIYDTLIDIANLALIAHILYEEKDKT